MLFVVLPFDLARDSQLREVWKVAVPAVVVGLTAMAFTARLSDRKNQTAGVLYVGTSMLFCSCLLFGFVGQGLPGTLTALVIFVLSVALLEPALPSLMTRFAVGKHRGTAMGVFHMSQFLGTFTGGLLGGAYLQRGRAPLFLGLAALVLLWLFAISRVGRWRPGEQAAA